MRSRNRRRTLCNSDKVQGGGGAGWAPWLVTFAMCVHAPLQDSYPPKKIASNSLFCSVRALSAFSEDGAGRSLPIATGGSSASSVSLRIHWVYQDGLMCKIGSGLQVEKKPRYFDRDVERGARGGGVAKCERAIRTAERLDSHTRCRDFVDEV